MSKYFVDYLPITAENTVKLYTDGEQYCLNLYADLRAAKRIVLLTGLHFMADFRLVRGRDGNDKSFQLSNVLKELGERGVEVFLLVNQFWKDESEVRTVKNPLRTLIMIGGELDGYLPETYRLFKRLSNFKSIHCRTDIHPHSDTFGTNHQKTIVIDDEIAYLGGIDLTYLDGDRWDTAAHKIDHRAVYRTQKYWHDVHIRLTGHAVSFVRDNFEQRWTYGNLHRLFKRTKTFRGDAFIETTEPVITAIPDKIKRLVLPPMRRRQKLEYKFPNGTEDADLPMVQIVRSMPFKENWANEKPIYNRSSLNWERSCKDAYLIGIRAAQKYIYLENQWVSDEDIWNELASAAYRNKANVDFRIILMIPLEPLFAAGLGSNQELFITAEMQKVISSGYNAATFGMYSLRQVGNPPKFDGQIYVHSKILIIDDEWSLIGSANSGGISLEGIRGGQDRPDSELSAIILDRKFATNFRRTLWEEHTGKKIDSTYRSSDADQFRILAGMPGKKLKFFPDYDRIRSGIPLPYGIGPLLMPLKRLSRIVPSFDKSLQFRIPLATIKVSFKAFMVPPAPPGFRCLYRWRLELIISETQLYPLGMLSLKNNLDEVRDYSDQDAVYIGTTEVAFIEKKLLGRNVLKGKIYCNVVVIPITGPIGKMENQKSILLEYDCVFVRSKIAKKRIGPDPFVR